MKIVFQHSHLNSLQRTVLIDNVPHGFVTRVKSEMDSRTYYWWGTITMPGKDKKYVSGDTMTEIKEEVRVYVKECLKKSREAIGWS